jgi:hypothetical protein
MKKHQLGKITPQVTGKALREAERQLVRPPAENGREPLYVDVRPQDIVERLELFQPRRPGWGLRTVDAQHVKRLATRIKKKGELDPVLVVKLGGEWVVVEGHHRIRAYQKLNWDATIRCQWFAGGAREAMDAGLYINEKIHLPIDQDDKAEAAWTRTMLDWDGETWRSSKQAVAKLTGCSERMVAYMRQVVRQHHDYAHHGVVHPIGERLCRVLGPDLSVHSWNKVNTVRLDVTRKEGDLNEAAAALARQLDSRMPILRTTDPEVIARALWLYIKDSCPKLVEALQAHIEKEQRAEAELEDLVI